MELWDWLKPWWYWWSDLTALFDWSALAVVATVVAGAWALSTWRSSLQDQRRREGALIQAAAYPIGVLAKTLSATINRIAAGDDARRSIQVWLSTRALEMQIEALRALPIAAMPSALTVDLIGAAKASALGLENFANVMISAQSDAVAQAALDGIVASYHSLHAYGWRLEREAERIAGRLDTYAISSLEDIQDEMAAHDLKLQQESLAWRNRLHSRFITLFSRG